MSKIILTIGKNYVSSWTVEDAVRELLQNMYDQEALDSTNKGTVASGKGYITISNAKSELTKGSLILGNGTKSEDASTIGKFGEGYKLALLVLLRNGIEVVIHNYHLRETWRPTIEYTKQFDAELLVINNEKHYFVKPKHSNLTFELWGEGLYDGIIDNLVLNKAIYDAKSSSFGDILMSGPKGKIYVDNLFVTDIRNLEYSYSLKPKYIDIGRDRNLVNDFDIKWVLASMWKTTKGADLATALLNNIPDVEHIQYNTQGAIGQDVKDTLLNSLESKVPVVDDSDIRVAKTLYGKDVETTIVSKPMYEVIKNDYIKPKPKLKKPKSLDGVIFAFKQKHRKQLTKVMLKDLNTLMLEARKYKKYD